MLLLLVLAFLPSTGCFSIMVDAQGGYTSSMRLQNSRQGLAGQLSGGLALGDETAEHIGTGAGIRGKITDDVKQLALTPHVYYLDGTGTTAYGRAGVNLIQVESVDSDFAFGMFSPYGEVGMFLTPLVLSVFAEYDLRFTHQANEGFFGIMVGYGAAASSSDL